MKVRFFTLTLCLVTVLCVVGLSFAVTQTDGPITGTGSISKSSGQVRAHASATASSAAQTGWYWVHVQVLPYNSQYQDQASDPINGYFYASAYVSRSGQPKSNGRAYCSMWATSSQGYHSVLIDLP